MADDDARETRAKDAKAAALEKSAAAARAAAKGAPRAVGHDPAASDPALRRAAREDDPPPRDKGRPPAPEPRREGAPVLDVDCVFQRYPSPSSTMGLRVATSAPSAPNPNRGYQVVLNDITLRVPEHDFISVVGPSGCGKSTLLRLVLGSESPWKGTVHANGGSITHPDRRRGIVFQKYSLFPHLTVLGNVLFGLELDGTWLLQKWLTWPWYRKTHHKRYVELAMHHLATVKLDEHAGKYPHQLSGGMQQRVAIAQALIMQPTILLMDEPFGALDPGTREALQVHVVETFQKSECTVFFVTHDLEEALFVGRRLVVLSQHYRGEDGGPAHGSKVVMDVRTPKGTAPGVKQSAAFQEFIADVRSRGFDPKSTQTEANFKLEPPAG